MVLDKMGRPCLDGNAKDPSWPNRSNGVSTHGSSLSRGKFWIVVHCHQRWIVGYDLGRLGLSSIAANSGERMVVGHSGIVFRKQVSRSTPTKPTSSKSTRSLAGPRKLEVSEWNEELRHRRRDRTEYPSTRESQETLRGSEHDGPSSRYGESRIAQEGQRLRGPRPMPLAGF